MRVVTMREGEAAELLCGVGHNSTDSSHFDGLAWLRATETGEGHALGCSRVGVEEANSLVLGRVLVYADASSGSRVDAYSASSPIVMKSDGSGLMMLKVSCLNKDGSSHA
jgi:hypothetical protein